MNKGKVYITTCPDNPPDWYWVRGLHDACILGVEAFEFPFDYDKYAGDKKSYNRNLLTIKIDAVGALFDQDVKEIRLFNYKVITKDTELLDIKKVWWMGDRLAEENGHYTLEIDLQKMEPYPVDFILKLWFERAEVIR